MRNSTWRYAAAGTGSVVVASISAYAALAGWTWWRYGRVAAGTRKTDRLLDRFIPDYDVVERHHIRVAAPAEVTLEAAKTQDLLDSPVVRAIFRTRELAMGGRGGARLPRTLLEQVIALGWGVLAEEPGREIVVGAVTRPWEADVIFRALPPDTFAAFNEPGYVKIAWTLRADPDGAGSVFRTETRAVPTDDASRARFRRYWSLVSPGVWLIRYLSLRPLRREAERRARARALAPAALTPVR